MPVRRTEPADRRSTWPARARCARAAAARADRRDRRAHDRHTRVPAIPLHALRRGAHGRARGVAPRKHYGFAAIAMALALWLIAREPVREVRRRVCAWQVTRETTSSWPTLRRWRRAMGDRLAQIAIGRAPPHVHSRDRWALAFAGGSAMP